MPHAGPSPCMSSFMPHDVLCNVLHPHCVVHAESEGQNIPSLALSGSVVANGKVRDA